MAPSQADIRPQWLGVGVAVLVVAAALGWYTLRQPRQRLAPIGAGGAAASANSLVPLMPYVAPVVDSTTPATAIAAPSSFARDPFLGSGVVVASARRDRPADERLQQDPDSGVKVSAILITDTRRAAVINDNLVNLGARLPSGARLTDVERDRVVLTDTHGTRRTITITGGDG